MTAAQVGNGARLSAQPVPDGGTPTQTWVDAGLQLPELDLTTCRELVVVGAHPDDETLGFGATAALLAESGVRAQIVSATDGGAAYPELSLLQRYRLEQTRREELRRAAGVLGLYAPVSLGLPDGQVAAHQQRLADLLVEILDGKPPGTWCAAPWRGDGHPDHEAVGRAAAVAVEQTGAVLVEYPVWMWHWARPGDTAVPWGRAQMTRLTEAALERKQRAARCFESQFTAPTPGGEPVLPPAVVHRLLTVGEVAFR
ncbi:LmbE family protein [Mycolicibacterium chubuense]|uniref:1D-myo-inositol 2-acetamido-2-deoxy-alpha-D-glucopyranoside deacetylase n=1 Tax=Mycolicibacterium chubuense TaxID=1800 RepID=A0A0J6VTJ6_MYCCU|nr:PIG-L family deacetylase [Mycolicibacterium chubuense]KMO72792.1 1D-myo-inositol 2-acetamido-2-deoxy-alpha-D-glucopyranoside deacetylase [Mycolicibacterium chubuense]ORA46777.1 LmbE family protein [Mycolicibacterium chubuense]SPX99702.1 putative LmbE-like protein [Mycolicibacterium chubuense]